MFESHLELNEARPIDGIWTVEHVFIHIILLQEMHESYGAVIEDVKLTNLDLVDKV